MILTCILIGLAAFLSMEGIAWLSHKYIMHGWLWKLHRDHHKKDTYGFFEKNDYFFLIFAIPGILCLAAGLHFQLWEVFSVGIGITIYGFCYFLVHDVFIHQRFKLFSRTDNRYFRAIRRAHKMHHKHLDKEHGECFGMLWVPVKYFKETNRPNA